MTLARRGMISWSSRATESCQGCVSRDTRMEHVDV